MHEKDKPIKPHRIADEYYYIGTGSGPANLLVTGDGLVMIDTSWPESLEILLANIRELGFDPMDIRHIVHSHGHLDHFGCTAELVKMTGAKTYLGAPDLPYVDPSSELCIERNRPYGFLPDVLIADGDVIDFGGVKIRFVSTPGHTPGVVSMFMTLHIDGTPYLAGCFGGAGLNTLTEEYLSTGRFPFSMRERFIESIDKIISEPVELHLGNHIANNNGKEKMLRTDERPSPYVAENTWVSFLSGKRAEVERLIEERRRRLCQSS